MPGILAGLFSAVMAVAYPKERFGPRFGNISYPKIFIAAFPFHFLSLKRRCLPRKSNTFQSRLNLPRNDGGTNRAGTGIIIIIFLR